MAGTSAKKATTHRQRAFSWEQLAPRFAQYQECSCTPHFYFIDKMDDTSIRPRCDPPLKCMLHCRKWEYHQKEESRNGLRIYIHFRPQGPPVSNIPTDVPAASENSYKKTTRQDSSHSSNPAQPAILRRQTSLRLDLPALAADGVAGVEQVVGVIFLLDGQELVIVGSPEGLLPVWLGRVGLLVEKVLDITIQ